MRSFSCGVVAACALAVVVFAQPASAKSRFEGGTNVVPCGDGEVKITPIQLWPPNHKLQDIHIDFIDSSDPSATSGDNDNANEAESLTVNSITSSQASDDGQRGEGCGKNTSKQGPDSSFSPGEVTGNDPTPIGTTVQVRAERCAKIKQDRTYDINVSCGDNDTGGNPTNVDLTVTVPHDRRHAHKVSEQ